jgi:hypothetical protein
MTTRVNEVTAGFIGAILSCVGSQYHRPSVLPVTGVTDNVIGAHSRRFYKTF